MKALPHVDLVVAHLGKTFPYAEPPRIIRPPPPPPTQVDPAQPKNGRPLNPSSTMGRVRQILMDANLPITSAGVAEVLMRRFPEEHGKTNAEKVSALLCQEHKRGKIVRGKVGGKAVWSIGETQ